MPIYAATPKDPDDTEDLTWDWSRRLTTGETISGFSATVVDGAWTVTSTSISGTTTIARVTGGAAGSTCSVRGRMTTSAGRQLDCTLYVPVAVQ